METSFSRYRELILLLETGAYLHDIGKLSRYFITSKAKGIVGKDFHGQIIFIDKRLNRIPPYLNEFLNTKIEDLVRVIDKPFELDFTIGMMICAHHGCSRCLSNTPCPLKERIEDYKVLALLKTMDHMDASNPSDMLKQGINNVRIDGFFEEKEVPLSELDRMRWDIYEKCEATLKRMKESKMFSIEEMRRAVYETTRPAFLEALSDTRRCANDITLFDHSLATATLFKAFLSAYLYFDLPIPKSFREVRYYFLKGKFDRKFIEEECALSNIVFTYKGFDYIVYPYVGRKDVKSYLKKIIGPFEIVKDPYDIFKEYKDFLLSLKVKELEHIYGNIPHIEKYAIFDVKRLIYFALLQEKEQYEKKLKSFKRHIRNVSNGIIKDRRNFLKFLKKLIELKRLKKHLESKPDIKTIKAFLKVNRSKECEPYIENYFDRITSPLRPPSPKEMGEMFLSYYRATHSFKKVLNRFVLIRPPTLGRLIAFGRASAKRPNLLHTVRYG
uniref:Uncharacterized protein n=1 Tax=Caldisericum exile TaxID=693075 RepID=A0A7C4Y456_9BACT